MEQFSTGNSEKKVVFAFYRTVIQKLRRRSAHILSTVSHASMNAEKRTLLGPFFIKPKKGLSFPENPEFVFNSMKK